MLSRRSGVRIPPGTPISLGGSEGVTTFVKKEAPTRGFCFDCRVVVSLATEPAYGIMKQLLNKWDPCGYYLFRARMVGNRVRQEGNTDEGKLGKE